tara:strand:+ start:16964 stop:17557 length:594 start_codon:yes stop_codon:yes gene_type:complete
MTPSIELNIFFNFRSPYCYLASKKIFSIFDEFHVKMAWKPLGGWSGRSAPDRAKTKLPLARQDVMRYARVMGIPFTPPPKDTEPTLAAVISLIAEEEGVLEPYVVEIMHKEWAEGRNIGDIDVVLDVGAKVGLDKELIQRAVRNEGLFKKLESNWEEAQKKGVFGVPTFVVDDQIFWGNDRIDFLKNHLRELGLRKR